MAEVVGALCGAEAAAEVAQCCPQHFGRADRLGAEQRLELGEGQLDRVEIGAVGWDEQQRRAGCRNGIPNASDLMDPQIVHDDDLAWLERRRQHLLNIGEEQIAVDRPVDDHRGGQAAAAQRADKGRGFPMSVRHGSHQAVATPAPSVAPGHVGLHPGLIDEYQPRWG